MKKLILLLTTLLFLCAGSSLADVTCVVIGGHVGGGESDPCSCTGSYDACFSGQYSADHDNACYDSGTGQYNATIQTTGGTAEVTDVVTNAGPYSIHIDGSNDNVAVVWPNTGTEFEPTGGFLDFHIYCVDLDQGSNSQIFEAVYDSQNRFIISILTTDYLYVRHEHSDNVTALSGTSTQFSVGSWHHVQVRWRMNSGTDEIQLRVCSDNACSDESWDSESDADSLADFADGNDASYWGFGRYSVSGYDTVNHEFYIDDAYLWDNYGQN